MSWIGLYLFVGVANDVLVASLAQLAPQRLITDLQFLTFNPTIMIFNSVGILVLSLIATLAPLIMLKRLKPINIIKAKE